MGGSNTAGGFGGFGNSFGNGGGFGSGGAGRGEGIWQAMEEFRARFEKKVGTRMRPCSTASRTASATPR